MITRQIQRTSLARMKCVIFAAIGILPALPISAKAEVLHLLCQIHRLNYPEAGKNGQDVAMQLDVDTDRQEVSWVAQGASGVDKNEVTPSGTKTEVKNFVSHNFSGHMDADYILRESFTVCHRPFNGTLLVNGTQNGVNERVQRAGIRPGRSRGV
jgi:hypothetical protein